MLKDKQFIRVDNEEEYEKLYEICKLEFGFKGDYVLVDEYPVILEVSDIVGDSVSDNMCTYDAHFFKNCNNNSYVNKILNSKYCIPFSSLNNYVLRTELLDKLYDLHQNSKGYDYVVFSKDVFLIQTIANYFKDNYNYVLSALITTRTNCDDGIVGLFFGIDTKDFIGSVNNEGVLSLYLDYIDSATAPTHGIDADYFINKDVIYDKINKHLYKDGEITSRKIDVINFLSEVIYEEAKIKQ